MEYTDFIDKYGLTMKIKPLEGKLDKFCTLKHVVYKVKIKSNILGGKLKTEFTTAGKPELDEILNCLLMDASGADYSFKEFCNEFGINGTSDTHDVFAVMEQNQRCYDGCIKEKAQLEEFFGVVLDELMECEQL